MRNLLLRLLLIVAVLMSGCGLSAKQEEAATDSIKALGKIEAATQVGVNYQSYGQLIIEAKAKVNEASSLLPEGDLKTELNASIEAYADAAQVWAEKIQNRGSLYSKYGIGETVIPKYSIPTVIEDHDPSGLLGNRADADMAIQLIWATGKARLARAKAFLEGETPPDLPAPLKSDA